MTKKRKLKPKKRTAESAEKFPVIGTGSSQKTPGKFSKPLCSGKKRFRTRTATGTTLRSSLTGPRTT
jgi:hypothetical protein